ncbi:MAG: DNA polymerase Y family protein [Gammaproteobacteria bacterium]|nr:DNA polymerase Y family protein [Gammaproteobacteria bacterium]
MLWCALFFPQLPVDMQVSTLDSDNPVAVITQDGARRLIMAVDDTARELGIHPGLTLNSAYAIAPELHLIDYDEQAQQRYLEQLSLWALNYSSWVTPRAPDVVLIELAASLRLFGGLDSLLDRLQKGCNKQGLHMQYGVAPTPAAASLLAHVEPGKRIEQQQALTTELGSIGVEYLPLDNFTLKGLRQSGIRHCKQLFRLPAAALNRRFGTDCSTLIFKLLGTLPDPCPAFTVTDNFAQGLDLPLEAPDANALQFPLNRLLAALGGFLKSHDQGVLALRITLGHLRHDATHIDVVFLEATSNHKHLMKVILERLDKTTLPVPATSIHIETLELAEVPHHGRDLLQKSQCQPASIQQTLDNLAARLGSEKLYTPLLTDDHRPEKAWASALLADNKPPENWPARPVWLLREPRQADRPLERVSSAERIENGWWDNTDVRRDYYIARDRDGISYWVFADRREPETLYIHGLFA